MRPRVEATARYRRRGAFRVGLIAACVIFLAGCARSVVYHRVRPGETLYRIGKAYGVSPARIADANGIANVARIEVGTRLQIPGAQHELPVNVITPQSANGKPLGREEASVGNLAWPVPNGTVSSGFGERGRNFHDGIDISVPAGTPIRAAQDGDVLYSDSLRGYGNVIILRHRGGYATVYAHNQSNKVREGQRVRKGDVIGAVGDSGRASGPNLHFEVRKDNVARNPLYFLPPVAQVSAPEPSVGRGG